MEQRVIKFRGHDYKGNWQYGYYYVGVMYPTSFVGHYINDVLVDPKTICQFTGLHDKNGKEIYESDWCTAKFRTKEGIKVIQGKIIMDEYMWCIDCVGCVGDDIFSINRPHDFEVIGNIYENTELI